MTVSVHSSVSCAIAAAGVSALVAAPAPLVESRVAGTQPAIVLAAQVQQSTTPTALAALAPQPFTLAAEQVNFHVTLFVDFIVTGAQLVGRQVAIPGTLLQDIEAGTPLPVALSRAVQTFAQIELDAGGELLGFAAQYVDFQVRFIAGILQDAVAVATAIPVAVGELAASTVSHFAPTPAAGQDEAISARAAQAEAVASDTEDGTRDAKAGSTPRSIESTTASNDETKVSAQGEIRSTASTVTADVDATEVTGADEGDATGTSDIGGAEEKTAVSNPAGEQRDDAKPNSDRGADDAARGDAGQ